MSKPDSKEIIKAIEGLPICDKGKDGVKALIKALGHNLPQEDKSEVPKDKKYILLENDTKTVNGVKLKRIKYSKEFAKKNYIKELSNAYIESEMNLSQEGDAQVYGDAHVYGNARVYGDARVFGDAHVFGDAFVYGNTSISKGGIC